MYEWADEMNCAVTVCDTQGIILYMNEKACRTFAGHGNLIGRNLFDCHSPKSQEKIRELLETGGVNAYTIEKKGVRKMSFRDRIVEIVSDFFIMKIINESTLNGKGGVLCIVLLY